MGISLGKMRSAGRQPVTITRHSRLMQTIETRRLSVLIDASDDRFFAMIDGKPRELAGNLEEGLQITIRSAS